MRSGELFAGVGGLGMAVDEVFNAQPSWFCEFDAAPSKVLAHHFPDVPNFGDVRTVDWANTERVNILAGGFPCQDVSLAGRRRGMNDGTRSGLWSEFAKAIDEIRPDWVVIENVRGLLSADAAVDMEPCPLCVGDNPEHVLRALGAVLGDLADLGFDAEWIGLRAADIGAPHGRFRVFILAWPRERTVVDPVGIAGWRSADTREADRRPGIEKSRVTLLATPRATDMNGVGAHGDGGLDLRTQIALLPTPMVGSSSPAAHGQISGDFRAAMERVLSEVTLLPTPVAQPSGNTPEDHLRKKPGREVVTDLAIIAENGLIETGVRILPTPTVGDKGGVAARGGHGFGSPLGEVARSLTDWGPYAGAINRWEQVVGRPAPAPVRFDGKGGKARLNPELTEWMMGWPAGWVTDPAIGPREVATPDPFINKTVSGLSRAEQLKACGNGVVPQQAAAALRVLLARPGVPAISEAVST